MSSSCYQTIKNQFTGKLTCNQTDNPITYEYNVSIFVYGLHHTRLVALIFLRFFTVLHWITLNFTTEHKFL